MAFPVDHMTAPNGGANNWPLVKFYFEVQIDNVDGTIGFQAVEGLESEVSVMEYRAGNYALWAKTKRPGLMTYSNVTLKKGMFRNDANLHDWWSSLANDHRHADRRTIIINMYNEDNEVVLTWTLEQCFVTKFTPSSLDAEADSEVAIEELEIATEKMTMVYG